MSSQAGALRPFHPLSGNEVKQIILDEIKKKLDSDSRFANNISYPLISWKWKLAVNAYPSDKPEFSLDAGGEVGDPAVSETIPIPIDLEAERSVTAPVGQSVDAARSDAGLAIPFTRSAPGPEGSRVQIDAPGLPLDAKGAPKPAAPALTAEENVPGPKGIVARRATAKTKAAPKGVSVEQAGTAPHNQKDE